MMDARSDIDLTDADTRDRLDRIARHVVSTRCGGWDRADKDDFIAEAPGLIELQKSKYKGPDMGRWAWSVLRNRAVQLGKQKQRRRVLLDRVIARRAESRSALASVIHGEQLRMYRQPFSDSDMATIRSWSPKKRLLLLVLAELWTKVGLEEWQSWCQDFGMKQEYPPPMWRSMIPAKQRACIAKAIGVNRGALDTEVSRWRLWLLQLEYCRDYLGFEEGCT